MYRFLPLMHFWGLFNCAVCYIPVIFWGEKSGFYKPKWAQCQVHLCFTASFSPTASPTPRRQLTEGVRSALSGTEAYDSLGLLPFPRNAQILEAQMKRWMLQSCCFSGSHPCDPAETEILQDVLLAWLWPLCLFVSPPAFRALAAELA